MAYQGNTPVLATMKKLDALTFNGATTSFALTVNTAAVSAAVAEALIISINGVIQESGVAYTVSSGNIVFSTAPQSTDTFFGVLLGVTFNVANAVPLSGGTMTGDLVLSSSTPATSLSATSKAYVQAQVGGASAAGNLYLSDNYGAL